MNKNITFTENNNLHNIFKYEEFYLIKENNVYKFIISKREKEVLIQCKNYEIKLNSNNISIILNSMKFKIEQAYDFIVTIFEQNQASIKDIIINKTLHLILKAYIDNEEKNIEILLFYNKKSTNLIINDFNNKYVQLINNNINLKDEIKTIKNEIDKLKSFYEDNINNNINGPLGVNFIMELTKDSYSTYHLYNSFTTFKSINDIFYLIYANKVKSMIIYNLEDKKKINEIKRAHDNYISNFRHYLDNINKRDLVMSISAIDNNIKIWNINNLECLVNIRNINQDGFLYSSCILNDNNKAYIVTSNQNIFNLESIKIFDFNGNKIKEINDSNDSVFCIDSFYDIKYSKSYIVTGNNGYIKSYDFNENKLYHKYMEGNNNDHKNIIIYNRNDIIKLIEGGFDGYVRIWNFHSPLLINKIKSTDNSPIISLCLWDKNFLFIGSEDAKIKLVDLNRRKIIKTLLGHNKLIINIQIINLPKYGKSIISQGWQHDQIKLWSNN